MSNNKDHVYPREVLAMFVKKASLAIDPVFGDAESKATHAVTSDPAVESKLKDALGKNGQGYKALQSLQVFLADKAHTLGKDSLQKLNKLLGPNGWVDTYRKEAAESGITGSGVFNLNKFHDRHHKYAAEPSRAQVKLLEDIEKALPSALDFVEDFSDMYADGLGELVKESESGNVQHFGAKLPPQVYVDAFKKMYLTFFYDKDRGITPVLKDVLATEMRANEAPAESPETKPEQGDQEEAGKPETAPEVLSEVKEHASASVVTKLLPELLKGITAQWSSLTGEAKESFGKMLDSTLFAPWHSKNGPKQKLSDIGLSMDGTFNPHKLDQAVAGTRGKMAVKFSDKLMGTVMGDGPERHATTVLSESSGLLKSYGEALKYAKSKGPHYVEFLDNKFEDAIGGPEGLKGMIERVVANRPEPSSTAPSQEQGKPDAATRELGKDIQEKAYKLTEEELSSPSRNEQFNILLSRTGSYYKALQQAAKQGVIHISNIKLEDFRTVGVKQIFPGMLLSANPQKAIAEKQQRLEKEAHRDWEETLLKLKPELDKLDKYIEAGATSDMARMLRKSPSAKPNYWKDFLSELLTYVRHYGVVFDFGSGTGAVALRRSLHNLDKYRDLLERHAAGAEGSQNLSNSLKSEEDAEKRKKDVREEALSREDQGQKSGVHNELSEELADVVEKLVGLRKDGFSSLTTRNQDLWGTDLNEASRFSADIDSLVSLLTKLSFLTQEKIDEAFDGGKYVKKALESLISDINGSENFDVHSPRDAKRKLPGLLKFLDEHMPAGRFKFAPGTAVQEPAPIAEEPVVETPKTPPKEEAAKKDETTSTQAKPSSAPRKGWVETVRAIQQVNEGVREAVESAAKTEQGTAQALRDVEKMLMGFDESLTDSFPEELSPEDEKRVDLIKKRVHSAIDAIAEPLKSGAPEALPHAAEVAAKLPEDTARTTVDPLQRAEALAKETEEATNFMADPEAFGSALEGLLKHASEGTTPSVSGLSAPASSVLRVASGYRAVSAMGKHRYKLVVTSLEGKDGSDLKDNFFKYVDLSLDPKKVSFFWDVLRYPSRYSDKPELYPKAIALYKEIHEAAKKIIVVGLERDLRINEFGRQFGKGANPLVVVNHLLGPAGNPPSSAVSGVLKLIPDSPVVQESIQEDMFRKPRN